MSIGWKFSSSDDGIYDGFNDAGIEIFTGARYNGLAREIIQNSLDATKDESKVTVEFDFVKIARDDFWGADELLKAMKQCKKECKDEKGKVFFKNAVQVMQKSEIPCLRISDSGTTGLRGDYRKRKGQWYAITKTRGISEKGDNTTAGGSFGIGKNAPFAVSSLRTVFYSTLYMNDSTNILRAQGITILMSHESDGGKYTRATGFYGETDGCMPIEGSNIPDILRPDKQGCVVFIPGFVTEYKWWQKIMATVVSNFFCAIAQGKLEVLIQNENQDIELIDQANLDECFRKIIDDPEIDREKVENSYHYYKTMNQSELFQSSELHHLGHCKMWVQMREGLPKRVALLRKTGMLITDDQAGLKRWAGRSDFVGVFMCDSVKGNSLLRDMENPQHNAFESERAIPEQRKKCKDALNELVSWVRRNVDKLAKPEETETTAIDELGKFFPDVDSPEAIPGDGERDIEGRPIFSPKPLKRAKPKADNLEDEDGDDGGSGEGGDGDGSGEDGDGLGEGSGTGGTGTRGSKPVAELRNVRIVSDTTDPKKKTVHFTPMKSGRIDITLAIMGDDGNTENISVDVNNSDSVSVEVEANKRESINVTLNDIVNDSIAVKASATDTKNLSDEITTK